MGIKWQIKKKQKNKWKRYAGLIHLWLGLLSGIIVFIMATTGCIYVFHDEIKDLVYDWRFVEEQNQSLVNPSLVFSTVKEAYPEAFANMVVYNGPKRPGLVYVQLDGVPHNVYFNPYSAKITHVQNLDTDFFMIIEELHRFLLLPETIGKQITGVATIIFLMMLVTGLILWFPKQTKSLVKHFVVKWKAKWKRINYDVHRVSGIYILLPAAVIAITGLSFSYEWMHESFYAVGNAFEDEKNILEIPEFKPSLEKKTTSEALDKALQKTFALLPESGMAFIWDQGSGLPVLTGAYPETLDFDHQSNFYFDCVSGELLYSQLYDNKNLGMQLQEMNYGLHTGQFFNLAGKIIAFVVSLLVAMLPVTGVLIWYGRHKKAKFKPL